MFTDHRHIPVYCTWSCMVRRKMLGVVYCRHDYNRIHARRPYILSIECFRRYSDVCCYRLLYKVRYTVHVIHTVYASQAVKQSSMIRGTSNENPTVAKVSYHQDQAHSTLTLKEPMAPQQAVHGLIIIWSLRNKPVSLSHSIIISKNTKLHKQKLTCPPL